MTTPTDKSVGFSGHAHGNPSRYVPKAPPESVSSFEAVSFRPGTVTAGHDSEVESGAKILPGNPLLAGTPRIFDCQAGLAELRPHKTSSLIIPQKGGAPDFLCRLTTTVPVR